MQTEKPVKIPGIMLAAAMNQNGAQVLRPQPIMSLKDLQPDWVSWDLWKAYLADSKNPKREHP